MDEEHRSEISEILDAMTTNKDDSLAFYERKILELQVDLLRCQKREHDLSRQLDSFKKTILLQRKMLQQLSISGQSVDNCKRKE